MASPAPAHSNRLAQAISPYLLQHQHNPVDWWPWGPDALAAARAQNKPILLSVGYAACHWCHVMAHESFEDDDTARVMNELFINIKVDREERPDIDQIYMNALHLLGQQGGWPLTMFLTPRGEPVWGGTYFPKDSRFGRPAFKDVLREVARLFREEPQKIEANRAALLARLAEKARPAGKVTIGLPELDAIAQQLGNMFDPANGGLRGAPKFPQAPILELLWRAGLRSGDSRFFETVEHSLERMCQGGIYDHLGGGFSRYSVDERWLVPHFEKMLYDNAQLLELLALAATQGGKHAALFTQRARETVGWLAREMMAEGGAFCASLDADSEGEEGKFYVWSKAEIESVLGVDDAEFIARFYDVTDGGNFEGHVILNRLNAPVASEADERRLAILRDKLLTARARRVRPGLDDKVLADWNGLMIAALVNAGVLLDEPDWIAMAVRAFDFIAREMTRDDRLGHSWRRGKLLLPGLASDFSNMGKAALALHEATGEHDYLKRALAWQTALDAHYTDVDTGGYYLTAADAEDLLLRPHATNDDATPNHNAVAAQNLIRLAAFAGDDQWRTKADTLIERILSSAGNSLFGQITLLNALDLRLGAIDVAIVRPAGADASPLLDAVRWRWSPNVVLSVHDDAVALPPSHPAAGKVAIKGKTTAYVCRGEVCSLPVTTSGELVALLDAGTV